MIARVWQGVVPVEKADAYGEYLAGFGVADYKQCPGNLGVGLMRHDDGDVCHFLFISYWTTRAALEAYAGLEIDKANYYEYDLECLLEPSETVRHYAILASTGAPQTRAPALEAPIVPKRN
jgi:hypothetical protein